MQPAHLILVAVIDRTSSPITETVFVHSTLKRAAQRIASLGLECPRWKFRNDVCRVSNETHDVTVTRLRDPFMIQRFSSLVDSEATE